MQKSKKKKKATESEFDKKIVTYLFVFIFFVTFAVEGLDRYYSYKLKKNK